VKILYLSSQCVRGVATWSVDCSD